MPNQSPKRALVLSGGSVKGAFQAGALPVILKEFTPDAIYGISVGSLNGAFLAERAGREIAKGVAKEDIDWVKIAEELESLWLTRINEPKSILQNKKLKLLFEILRNKFNGIADTKPLRKLMKETLDPQYLALSPVKLQVGTVDMLDGKIIYADQHHEDILDMIYASAAIPGIFPAVNKKPNSKFIDGAMRASAPIGKAIDDEMEDIVAVLCHAEQMNKNGNNLGNAKHYFERIMDIFSNEQITNDILIANLRKQIMDLHNQIGRPVPNKMRSVLLGKQCENLNMVTVRPDLQPKLKIESFNINDVKKLIAEGRNKASEEMSSAPLRSLEPAFFH